MLVDLNFFSRFINERIEAAVISRIKTSDGSSAARETSQAEDLSEVSHDPFSRYLDPSVTGVELVQLKNEQQKRKNATEKQHIADLAKDPLLSMDTRSSRSWNSLPLPSKVVDDIKDLQEHRAGEGWEILLFHGYTIHLKILVVVSVNTVKGMNITSKHPDINLAGRDPDVLDTLPMMIAMIDDSENDSLARSCSGTSATSSASYISVAGSDLPNALKSSLLVDSFDKLRCEVLGSNIVKSSSKMFAVYSVAVTDESNHSWSIKRRFRHFEELHRRLKVFPEYNLHLPPKHFLSTGVDIPVIQERCLLLDDYLKKLLQLPRISGSIEVRDFLSVDSQTYAFSSSFSIIETLTVKHVRQTSTVSTNMANVTPGPLLSREKLSSENGKSGQHIKNNVMVDDLKSKMKAPGNDQTKTSDSDVRNSKENGGLKKGIQRADAVAFTGLPTEWVPPKLTLPLLDLVDVVFQLQEGGWIRRKAFWVAKQILQLGMGDALDDWVLEKIRILRRGTVVASGIQRVEQILWPDGIFITKHPKRQQQSSSSDEEQQQEAERRAKFVRELMIEKAPATIVSLVGQKEYEQCAEDLYFFLQSSVCLKLLAYDLVELLLTSAFPEMEQSFKQLQEEKHLFGQHTPPT
ncbi:hypothetical protein Bca52824_062926 [Brassica carinata]|uniref:PX domain-containing protein n=1 Tax=Brassica carinata TaxID=52824 RepID=A0A8X7U9W1_BRACI|nr:hypothetical protein Bca52824_062926 [Brassica carinata]